VIATPFLNSDGERGFAARAPADCLGAAVITGGRQFRPPALIIGRRKKDGSRKVPAQP
jgi:hypothetical protein